MHVVGRVRTHPETGEKVLSVNGFTTHFTNYHAAANVRFGQGCSPGARQLLNHLVSQAFIPESQLRRRWRRNARWSAPASAGPGPSDW